MTEDTALTYKKIEAVIDKHSQRDSEMRNK